MRRAALCFRGARAVAAIRTRLSGELPAAVAPRRPRAGRPMLDLMPSPRLVYHEWDRHGTCSGLNSAGYFEAIRTARGKITVPTTYHELNAVRTVSPGDATNAFVAANPGLTKNSLAVTCDDKRLTGVRVCMTKDFRSANVRKSCGGPVNAKCGNAGDAAEPRGRRALGQHRSSSVFVQVKPALTIVMSRRGPPPAAAFVATGFL